jgi:hypothetical protein
VQWLQRHAQSEAAIGQEDVVWRALAANARAERRLTNSTAVGRAEGRGQVMWSGWHSGPSMDLAISRPPTAPAYAFLAIPQADE